MPRKSKILTVFIILFLIIFSGCLQTPSDNESGTFIVGYGSDADYQNIQDAIDAAENGNTIYVQEGKYYETLSINKSIHLISLEKNKSYIIGGNALSSSSIKIIQITAGNCSLDGFIITRNGTFIVDGVNIQSSNTTLINNTIINTDNGIFIGNETRQNTIIWNNIANTRFGIQIDRSINNTLAYNQFTNNSLYGAYVYARSNGNIIHNNTFYKNGYALRIKGSQDNTVFLNCFINNNWGVYLCCGATSNVIYHNVFKLNNDANVHEDNGLTNYFTVSPHGGNYYDDYDGIDGNNDSFGDTPYFMDGSENQDDKPLLNTTDFSFCKDIDN